MKITKNTLHKNGLMPSIHLEDKNYQIRIYQYDDNIVTMTCHTKNDSVYPIEYCYAKKILYLQIDSISELLATENQIKKHISKLQDTATAKTELKQIFKDYFDIEIC